LALDALVSWRIVMVVDGSEGGRRDHEHPDNPDQALTPPVMWPDDGSGFEADPFSPAGLSQEIWTATRRRPHSRAGRWFVSILCVLIAVAFIAAQVAH
jgi:hypothetical protein